jgi:hypothetical protein
MNLDLFTRCLDTFGSDFQRWPAEYRAAAEALLASSPDARARWQAAQRLDSLFALDRAAPVVGATAASLVDGALRRIRNRRRPAIDWGWLFGRPMQAALAATFAAGVLSGMLVGPERQTARPQGEFVISLLLGDGTTDLMEPL